MKSVDYVLGRAEAMCVFGTACRTTGQAAASFQFHHFSNSGSWRASEA
jgi:hypothetical protein